MLTDGEKGDISEDGIIGASFGCWRLTLLITMELSQVLLILQMVLIRTKIFIMLHLEATVFSFSFMFYMLLPLTPRQRCLYRDKEGKKSSDLWRQ